MIGIVVHRRSHLKRSPIDHPTKKIKEVEQKKENEGEEDRNREDEGLVKLSGRNNFLC